MLKNIIIKRQSFKEQGNLIYYRATLHVKGRHYMLKGVLIYKREILYVKGRPQGSPLQTLQFANITHFEIYDAVAFVRANIIL